MPELNVGICGAGIGGLAAAIAISKAGVKVTVLEAAPELGEIGAGIQMTPNVARLLMNWGVDKVIGDDLVEFEELNMRRKDGTLIGYTKTIPNVRKYAFGSFHRMHLHAGLAEVARREGANLVIDARVVDVDWTSSPSNKVTVTTAKGQSWTFDLLIGADGVRSTVRKAIMPQVKPAPPTGNCAYRALVPYDEIRRDPIAKELIEKRTMEVWMADKSYIISYPISGGKLFNMVLSHHVDHLVDDVQDIDMERDFRQKYKDYDPRIKRIVDMVTSARRWPLLVTGPLDSWSTKEKNIVLMGDAAHSMTNHMAQGAATSMEDGAFLARTLARVVEGKLNIAQAIEIYEKTRMPKAYYKQQVSFLNGAIWQVPDGPIQEARDKAMAPELKGEQFMRSPNLYGDPVTTLSVYNYDAEEDAEIAIRAYLEKCEPFDVKTGVTDRELERFVGWWWPKDKIPLNASKL
ncbi:uncharacterized protein A1O5_08220 [Cladophialophora psammophila CBS 110553]|uniref:FAD-binding domain-containing protein n=1 Tax=Cladophialophora psammophila CBS 110553 TaxID=1182543 RepID=W9WKK1_9EURO|nr:uncharacterized protein A1O5_08220 [Cladophialophora psammophila CBS 110553]EXJ68428.1 hypothetical protein A1O5_08220 [Cladophialophora psammophila CBS 110553]